MSAWIDLVIDNEWMDGRMPRSCFAKGLYGNRTPNTGRSPIRVKLKTNTVADENLSMGQKC